MSPLRILIVEDQLPMVEILENLLGKLRAAFPGSEILKVGTLAGAIAIAELSPSPDVILLDLVLEDVRDANETIAEIDRLSKICPVIVITGHAQHEAASRAAGAADFISKDHLSASSGWLVRAVSKVINPAYERRIKELRSVVDTLRKFYEDATTKDATPKKM